MAKAEVLAYVESRGAATSAMVADAFGWTRAGAAATLLRLHGEGNLRRRRGRAGFVYQLSDKGRRRLQLEAPSHREVAPRDEEVPGPDDAAEDPEAPSETVNDVVRLHHQVLDGERRRLVRDLGLVDRGIRLAEIQLGPYLTDLPIDGQRATRARLRQALERELTGTEALDGLAALVDQIIQRELR
jgi:hypothetical protein